MRKFLASVGNAKLLGKKNGQLYHIADVRTLTESTLSFANTQEEVRAGEGAQLYGRFSHDSGMTVTLTDAMFDINYIALQVGAELGSGSTNVLGAIETHEVNSSDEAISLNSVAQKIGNACGLDTILAWVREKGCEQPAGSANQVDATWKALPVTNNSVLSHGTTTEGLTYDYRGKTVCVQYFVSASQARSLAIAANFIPAELVLILTTKLFAGDATAPETGKPVGEVTVKIPRFSLDGQFDLSMAMSSAATISLNGTALAVDDGTSCDGKGIYAEIVEVELNSTAATGLVDIVVDEETIGAGKVPGVYGKYADGHIAQMSYDPTGVNGYKTSPALAANGTFGGTGTYAFSVTGSEVTESVTIS